MLLYYLIVAVSFFIIFYIIRFKRSYFYTLAKNSVGLMNEFISDASEDEKIDLVSRKTNQLAFSLLKLLSLIIIAFVIGFVPLICYALITGTSVENINLTSFYSILALSIGATIAFLIPIGKKSKSDYSELSQLLHHMALDNYNISNKLFKRETKKSKSNSLKTRSEFVIISGLARAGTTSLMNDLAKVDDFVSLSYANMPFVMSPITWQKIYKPKTKNLKERSHKDGIMIGYNSNEALEEYFFKVKANDSFIHPSYLSEYEISENDYADYLDYHSNIKQNNEKIYLAKNNNFILRYRSMRYFNEEFVMVILFRDPITHAASLKEKHEYYIQLQKSDPFVLDYMNWLGHHEFGLNHKAFVFSSETFDLQEDSSSLEYWVKIWINYYENVLSIDHPNTLFINYDSYCQEPRKTVERILDKVGISKNPVENKAFNNMRKGTDDIPEELNYKAQEIYEKLVAKSK